MTQLQRDIETLEEIEAVVTPDEAAAIRRVLAALKICGESVTEMAEDGWLMTGPEGFSWPQEKCYAAYKLINGIEES